MVEAEWLACAEPHPMLVRTLQQLDHALVQPEYIGMAEYIGVAGYQSVAGKRVRKWRLLSVALCRRVWSLLDNNARKAIELVEQFADGSRTSDDLKTARGLATAFQESLRTNVGMLTVPGHPSIPLLTALGSEPARRDAAEAVLAATAWDFYGSLDVDQVSAAVCAATVAAQISANTAAERTLHAHLVREVVGNPFRFVAVYRSWITPTVQRLATSAYEDREAPGGHIDNLRLAILADALEESGCSSTDLLEHLRHPGPHIRGCWALDLILGKR
jgi:hypothetical protein